MRSFLTSFSTFALFHFLQSPLACLSAMASRNPAASHDVRQHRGSYDPLSLSPMAKVGLDGDEVKYLHNYLIALVPWLVPVIESRCMMEDGFVWRVSVSHRHDVSSTQSYRRQQDARSKCVPPEEGCKMQSIGFSDSSAVIPTNLCTAVNKA